VLRRVVPLVAAADVLAGAAFGGNAAAATPPPTKGVVVVNTNLALENASAAGTGIVLTKNGEVLTNNHVIAGATTIKVTVPATKQVRRRRPRLRRITIAYTDALGNAATATVTLAGGPPQ
jgi:S1-C subfamily serine protease